MIATSSKPEVQTVLITGASSGIGWATAGLLSQNGYRVFGTCRSPSADTNNNFEMLPLEITSDDSVAECVENVVKRTGGQIDVLINNVGTGILGAGEESSISQVQKLFDINLFGAIRMTNAVLPFMRQCGKGKILFMSSSGGVASIPFAGYYCSTKHALEAYAESLRVELVQFGIQVSLIAPGPVSTNAGEKAIQPDKPNSVYADTRGRANRKFLDGIREGMPPASVAKAVLETLREHRPRARRTVGLQSVGVSVLKSVLPARFFEAAVKHASGMK